MFNFSRHNTKKFIFNAFTCTSVVIITGCANFTTSTNLDRSNFEEYFAPSKVTIYEKIEDLPQERQYVGIIEGEDCQIKERDEKPNPIDARTDARRKAHSLEANAIIFSQCVNVKHRHCTDLLICYSHAYKVIQE